MAGGTNHYIFIKKQGAVSDGFFFVVYLIGYRLVRSILPADE